MRGERFAAGGLLFALLAMSIASAQAPALPEGCERDGLAVTCQWSFDTRQEPGRFLWDFELPAAGEGFATVVVVLEGADGGWTTSVLDADGDRLTRDTHESDRQPSSTHHRDSYSLVVNETEARTFRFSSLAETVEVQGATVNNNVFGGASSGAVAITWHIEPFPDGVAPIRPAATREDPHLVAPALDARQGASDILAAWFDDASLGDGRFEVHLAVADASDWGWQDGGDYLRYHVEFALVGSRYQAGWNLGASSSVSSLDEVLHECYFGVQNAASNFEALVEPRCAFDWDNSTFSMAVPEAAVGNPSGAALFTDMRAEVLSGTYHGPTGTYSTSLDTLDDEAEGERYPFALGGPDVWDELNPRLAVPDPVAPAWYQAPLAKENVPDTLQVVGALIAAATFLGGLVFVRRSRRQTKELLARVDALAEAYARDARAGLMALGDLEMEFARLHRENKITDAQYQLAAQRLTTAATRFAHRRDLGLDDGTPG